MNRRVASAPVFAFVTTAILLSSHILYPAAQPSPELVVVQLLAFNDFHGNLEPPTGSNGRIGSTEAGGVEFLATHLARLESEHPNTITVAAGDLIGASPLLSGLFHDEPTIEALGTAGLDVASVGNHEFDDGWAELYRIQRGGCHPVDGCPEGTPYAGAAFQYLSANVELDPRKADPAALTSSGWVSDRPRSRTVLPAYVVKEIAGVKIGFVGLTLRDTARVVQAKGIQGLTFLPEAETVNRLIPVLKKQGVRAIVVLMHQGGVPSRNAPNACDGVSGPIEAIAARFSDEVDVIVSGHTHTSYICTFDGKLVTSAASFGRLITSIELRIDKATQDVVSKTARNIIVTRDVPKSAEQTAILARFRPFHAAVADKIVGTIASDITRQANAAGESALGNVIADAILEGVRGAAAGQATIAFMNPGGIRADLTREPSRDSGGAGAVSYGQAYSVLPFRNRLVVKTMSGAMIRKALEQQFDNPGLNADTMLQVSAGFSYSYDRSKPKGQRVAPASITLDGRPIGPKQNYRVGMTEFLGDGGDAFPVFAEAADSTYSGTDVDALVGYFSRHSPLPPPPINRIARTMSPPQGK